MQYTSIYFVYSIYISDKLAVTSRSNGLLQVLPFKGWNKGVNDFKMDPPFPRVTTNSSTLSLTKKPLTKKYFVRYLRTVTRYFKAFNINKSKTFKNSYYLLTTYDNKVPFKTKHG